MGPALAEVHIVVYCDRQLKSQIIAFLLPIFPNLVPYSWTCLSLIFCLFNFLPTSSQPSGQSASPILFPCPPNDYPFRRPAVTSSWHHPISKLWLCHVSMHMLWQKQYNQIGKWGSSTPWGLQRITGNEREKLFGFFFTEEDPAVLGGVRSSCQMKYLKGILSVFKISFIPPSIPLAMLLHCISPALSTVTHMVFSAFLTLVTALRSRCGSRNFLRENESPLPGEQIVLEPGSWTRQVGPAVQFACCRRPSSGRTEPCQWSCGDGKQGSNRV